MAHDSRVLAAFDFDGTISTRDTFFPFLLYAFGRPAVYAALARGLLELAQRDGTLDMRDRLKASLVRRLFGAAPREQLEAAAEAYARQVLASAMRPKALERIRWHREQGHRCVMVSASLDIYLQHVARALRFDDLLCTRLEAEGSAFTGELVGGNCRRAKKVERLAGLLGDLAQYRIYAYGDSAGDTEMLAIASERHFRPFA
jgi:phosphatidylglycerophosphatase C